jgi:single-stranded DNA-binding protein
MNQITLIGQLAYPLTYHCTGEGQDLVRFELRTVSTSGKNQTEAHHCTAWGPAALDLHQHLNVGDRLLINGELRYRRRRTRQGGTLRVPVIYVRGYSYLGKALANSRQNRREAVLQKKDRLPKGREDGPV